MPALVHAPWLLVVHAISLPEGIFGTGYPEALFRVASTRQAHDSFTISKGWRSRPMF